MMTWDPMDCISHRSLRAKTSRISSTWLSHGYGLSSITSYMPILPCPLCMICSFLCLCHAFVTHALHYTWWLILVLVCVFASLVEISLVIAMFHLWPIPMMILSSCFVFVLAICHVHCLCLLFSHMTWLQWFPLVCCIFALLACTTWLLCFLMLHHQWFILARFMWLMKTIDMLCTWFLLLVVLCLHMLPLSC